MTFDQIASEFDKLERVGKVRFLTLLAHQLTISMRGYYSQEPQVVNSHPGSPVGHINEIQHRLIAFIRDIEDEAYTSIDGRAVAGTLQGWSENGGITSDVIWAAERALGYVLTSSDDSLPDT